MTVYYSILLCYTTYHCITSSHLDGVVVLRVFSRTSNGELPMSSTQRRFRFHMAHTACRKPRQRGQLRSYSSCARSCLLLGCLGRACSTHVNRHKGRDSSLGLRLPVIHRRRFAQKGVFSTELCIHVYMHVWMYMCMHAYMCVCVCMLCLCVYGLRVCMLL